MRVALLPLVGLVGISIGLLLWSSSPLQPAAAQPEFEISALAVRGDVFPGTGGKYGNLAAGQPSTNSSGHIAFTSQGLNEDEVCGNFLAADGEITLLVEDGDPAPGTESTFLCFFGFRRSLTDNDVDYFTGRANQGQFGIRGIWGASASGVFKVALNGDDIVGSTSLQSVGIGAADPRANNLSSVAFLGTTNDGFGIYLARSGVIEKIVEEGDPSPAGGIFTDDCFNVPAIHPSEDVVYFTTCRGPVQGLFRWSGGAITTVLLAGDPAPGTNGVFRLAGFRNDSPDVNASGDILFKAIAAQTATSSGGQEGLWVIRDGVLESVILSGDPLPEVSAGVTIIGGYALSDTGVVAFSSGRLGEPQDGLFLWKDGGLSAVVLGGQLAPETSGTFTSFSVSRPFLEDRIAFLGATTDPVASTGVFVAECVNGSCGGEPPPPLSGAYYIALGDSVASGRGLLDGETACRRSGLAYPNKVLDELRSRYDTVGFKLLACSDATTKDLKRQVDEALKIIAALPVETDVLVSITVGINNFDWTNPKNVLTRVTQSDRQFDRWVDRITGRVKEDITDQIQRLLQRTNVAVVLTEYHNPFNRESWLFDIARLVGGCLLFTDCYGRTESAVLTMNLTFFQIRSALGGPQRLQVAPIYQSFRGRESPWPMCGSARPPEVSGTWIQYFGDPNSNSITDPLSIKWRGIRIPLAPGGDCFHPNERGAQAIADSVNDAAILAGR